MEPAGIEVGQVAADLMLRDPRTLPAGATVAEVRAELASPKVQMVLLAEHGSLLGAVTGLPAAAGADEQALDYADSNPETIAPDAPASTAFDRTAASPHRRLIVVDDDGSLLGLLCLNPSRTRFCRTTGATATQGRDIHLVAAFNVRGGPHPGADHADAAAELRAAARQLGARNLEHDAHEDAYTLTIDAPTVATAFQTVTDLFKHVYGDRWWAEVAVIPYCNQSATWAPRLVVTDEL